jgi:hypothetical protein
MRQQFLPEIRPQYSAYVIWRGLADGEALRSGIRDVVFERFTFHCPEGNEIIGDPIAGLTPSAPL